MAPVRLPDRSDHVLSAGWRREAGGSETLPPAFFLAYAFVPRCSAMACRNISSVRRMELSRLYCPACAA